MRVHLSRCVVRPLHEADAPEIARYANDRRIWRNLRDRFPHPYGEQDAHAFIAATASMQPLTVFAIEVAGKAAGAIGFEAQSDVERLSAEVGFWLGAPFWGRGIVTEALRAVTAHAFEHHDLVRLHAGVFDWNPASMRVLEKAGYQREGIRRRSAVKDGCIIDTVLYARVKG